MPASAHYFALVALAEAWPLCAPESFESSVVQLSHADRAKPMSSTGRLAAGFEAHARVLARGQSVSAIEAIRDHTWFGDASDNPRLTELVAELARRHLRWDGDAVRLASCAPDARHEQTMRWRWLSLRLPQDLLIAALATHERVEPCCDRVRLVGHALAPILERPLAETHLHMGAAIDFGELWIALMEGATRPDFGAELREGPAPFADPERYRRALVSAGLVRQLLASFLWHLEASGSLESAGFAHFVDHWLAKIAKRTGNRARASHVERACWTALAELQTGMGYDAGASCAVMLRAHHLLWGQPRKINSLDDLCACDPLASWLPPRPGLARPETRFIYRALLRLRDSASPDPSFERALWQYLRVRNLVFGYLVEAPGTAGLGWFTRHYDRLRAHRNRLGDRVAESALRLQSSDLSLASLELRTAPSSRWFEVRDEVRAIAAQSMAFSPAVGKPHPELALVLHFIKKTEEPGHYVVRCRHGRWFHDARRQADAVARALRLDPELLLLLRGLDVAAHELAVPTWALLPLFSRVRRASQAAARQLASTRPSWRVRPLRTTLHAGEEFRRLIEGLRRIHESVEFGLLQEGDRIGHGLALGWSTAEWVAQNPIAVQPREDRLFDLIWEIERYRLRQLSGDAGRLVFLRAQLDELSEVIFGEPVPERTLICFRKQLFNEHTLITQLRYPLGPRELGVASFPLLARYLVDPAVRRRAQAPIEVQADEQEAAVLEQTQRWLRGQLARLAITVEINPSSNLVIGDFADLREHPTFILSRVNGANDGRGDDQLPVSINSDDPLTFASCLADEYAYMEAALLGQGVAASSVCKWLDDAREAGWRSRFSLPASSDRACLEALIGRRAKRVRH